MPVWLRDIPDILSVVFFLVAAALIWRLNSAHPAMRTLVLFLFVRGSITLANRLARLAPSAENFFLDLASLAKFALIPVLAYLATCFFDLEIKTRRRLARALALLGALGVFALLLNPCIVACGGAPAITGPPAIPAKPPIPGPFILIDEGLPFIYALVAIALTLSASRERIPALRMATFWIAAAFYTDAIVDGGLQVGHFLSPQWWIDIPHAIVPNFWWNSAENIRAIGFFIGLGGISMLLFLARKWEVSEATLWTLGAVSLLAALFGIAYGLVDSYVNPPLIPQTPQYTDIRMNLPGNSVAVFPFQADLLNPAVKAIRGGLRFVFATLLLYAIARYRAVDFDFKAKVTPTAVRLILDTVGAAFGLYFLLLYNPAAVGPLLTLVASVLVSRIALSKSLFGARTNLLSKVFAGTSGAIWIGLLMNGLPLAVPTGALAWGVMSTAISETISRHRDGELVRNIANSPASALANAPLEDKLRFYRQQAELAWAGGTLHEETSDMLRHTEKELAIPSDDAKRIEDESKPSRRLRR